VFIQAITQRDTRLFLSQFLLGTACTHPGTSQRDTRLFLSQFFLGNTCVYPGTSQRDTRLFLFQFVLGTVTARYSPSMARARDVFTSKPEAYWRHPPPPRNC
jgi:hypothetical protein